MEGREAPNASASYTPAPTVATIEKTWRFDAAHKLPNHNGKCRELHGHTYALTIGLRGLTNGTVGDPAEGMVLDYYELSAVWRDHLEPLLDHKYLNDTVPVTPTTAENLAAWALDVVARQLGSVVAYVTVKETPATAATVWNTG